MSAAALPSRRPGIWRRLLRRPGSGLALAALLTVTLLALSAPWLPLPAPEAMDASRASRPPAWLSITEAPDGPPAGTGRPTGTGTSTGTGPPIGTGTSTSTGTPTGTGTSTSTGTPTGTGTSTSTGTPTGTGTSTITGTPAGTGPPTVADSGSSGTAPAGWAGLLGTDPLGRDLTSRIVWGARVSLLVGLAATAVAGLLGVAWGLLAGLARRRLDELLMRCVDVLDAVPFLFVVILLVAVLRGGPAGGGPDRMLILFLAIGAVSWLDTARIVRAQARSLRRRDFVLAAQALGAPPHTVALRHVLPNLWGVVLVSLTLTVPRVVLLESFLSFLGLGVEPPGISWGILASEGLENLTAVSTDWWLVVFPGLALAITLGSLNTLGDALRDALDPRSRAR